MQWIRSAINVIQPAYASVECQPSTAPCPPPRPNGRCYNTRQGIPVPEEEPKPVGRPAHHLNDTQSLFTNPWPSVGPKNDASVLGTMWAMLSEWKSKP
ncbi:hypothetical protein FIBSPDRAFT_1056225 [Athelia psychrophila]|uniref:Uncharacterized protein n=1 Tax=Athelia psychrophila TaxID=1759441 RepID=A0A167SHN8_9AGAM|nr:hypothetical protein FIBSPDRAFT_1056225 [Fibularhizoctonia sp. CBS 109695]